MPDEKPPIRANTLEYVTPIAVDQRYRVEMTVSCRDADAIPKVSNAGEITVENGVRVQVMHNGLRVVADAYCGPWMSEIISRLRGHHEPQEELIFDEVLQKIPSSATILELGGYWSYYSLWFLKDHRSDRRAYVIEPDLHHLLVGQRNAELNSANIYFTQGIVGGEDAEKRPFQTETSGTLHLPMMSVPRFLQTQKIERLDILHCDTQGAELAVVPGCEDLFRQKRISFAFISTHSHHISGDPLTHQRCLFWIREFGGQILAEHDVHESYSGDGLIVAYFGRNQIDWPAINLSYNRYSQSFFRNPLYDLSVAQHELSRNQKSW